MHLVIGANGSIGRALCAHWDTCNFPYQALCRQPAPGQLKLDLAVPPDQWALPEKIDTAFLCAARTNLQDCEEHRVETAWINVDQTIELGQRLFARNAFVVFLSSNLIFDGNKPFPRPEDRPCPATEYGRQKARTEAALLALSENVLILRLTKVVQPRMPFFLTWANSLRRGEIIHPFEDFSISPVPLSFVVNALGQIAATKPRGILQFSGDRDVSYTDCARMLAEHLQADPNLVQPIPAPVTPRNFASLDMGRATCKLGLKAPSVTQTLYAVFKSLI